MSELTNCGEYAYHLFKPNEVSSGTYVLQIFVKNCTKCDFIGSLENLIDRDKNINKSSAEITEEFIKSLDYQRPEEKRFTEMVNSDNPFVRVYFSLGRSKVVVANTVSTLKQFPTPSRLLFIDWSFTKPTSFFPTPYDPS